MSTPPVQLHVWAATDADAERAIRNATIGAGRVDWTLDVRRSDAPRATLNLEDPSAIAAEAGARWAYVAYPSGRADA